MASEVDICNLALSHVGDSAIVASITPPDGSVQADLCARFYPIARDTLLEMHDWGFATKSLSLALLSLTRTGWAYGYAAPTDLLSLIAILDPAAGDDYSVGMATNYQATYNQLNGAVPFGITDRGAYTPQAHELEATADGTDVIWTNQVNAFCRYVARVTDPSKFSNLFIDTLGWHLGSMVAGPLLKGESGVKASTACADQAMKKMGKATISDANDKNTTTTRDRHAVPWINGR